MLQAYYNSRDNHWLGILLQRYTALLLGVAMKYLKDKAAAEDAVQQVFIKVLTQMPAEEVRNFKGWLYILMRNLCLQQLRDKTYFADDNVLAYVPDAQPDKDELLAHEYTLQQLEEAVQQLAAEQQQAITLFYLKKYSYEQIITATGYTFMQVKSYIQNGKRNLKTILLSRIGKRQQ